MCSSRTVKWPVCVRLALLVSTASTRSMLSVPDRPILSVTVARALVSMMVLANATRATQAPNVIKSLRLSPPELDIVLMVDLVCRSVSRPI